MMDRGQQPPSQHHDQRHFEPPQYDSQPSPAPPRSHLSRSISYPITTQNSYTPQIHDNLSSTSLPKEDRNSSSSSYAGLGISIQGNDNTQTHHLLPSPDSPFGIPLVSRYGAGQPPTPSFPTLRSSSPASSIWSASDQGTSSSTLNGFIPRLHKYISLFHFVRHGLTRD